jgi:heat shock protein HslJ
MRVRRELLRTSGCVCVALTLILVVQSAHAAAASPPMICFGNEPSWSLQLNEPGKARFATPDEPSVDYVGRERRLDPLNETVWRGKRTSGQSGDLVAFLNHTACSDGMSDTTHPVTARISLADERVFAGCCRLVASVAEDVKTMPVIEGPTWRLTALKGVDAKALHSGDEPVTARFQDGRVSGFSGCNRFFGGYTLEGERIVIGQMAGSMMMCPEAAMALEHAVTGSLAGTFHYVVAGKTLTLRNETEPVLTFEAQPPPSLEGVTWDVTGFNNGRSAVVSPLLGTALSLTFKDGAVAGTAGCNTFHATYTAGPDSIVVGPVAATRRACLGDGVEQQEREFLAALQSATAWTLDGRMLDMHRPDGERVLTASPRAKK